MQCRWSGSTTHASMANGRSARVLRTACRSRSTSATGRCDLRCDSATVEKIVAPARRGRM
ncbi:hypothetical protein ACFFII_04625 [Paracoccus niistensis]|uniref:Uncharacterized protein n=1 Tax=Paracoccus niistensis TaxID=632935 RepID=A0ABV6I1U3_9RHOB